MVRAALTVLLILAATGASAEDRLCDTETENCRAHLLQLIRQEQQGIDVAFWYMGDQRFKDALILRFKAGVPIRLLTDLRAGASKSTTIPIVRDLAAAGIPIRTKISRGILHWKMMYFHGQNVVEFSKANYNDSAFVATIPGTVWDDEAIYFTSSDRLTGRFRTRFDSMWIDTSNYRSHANVSGPLVRTFRGVPYDRILNLPPREDFGARSVARYQREPTAIDVMVFRAVDSRHADALIAAVKRGVRVRLLHDPQQYRMEAYWRDAYNIDRMHLAGVEIKHRTHFGLMHEGAVILHGLGEAIFGSSNWEGGVDQVNHNLFYRPADNIVLDSGETVYQWFADQFERKWNNAAAFAPFEPLPPSTPKRPRVTAAGGRVVLAWQGGPWAYRYDVYLGTSRDPELVAADLAIGSAAPGVAETYTARLAPGRYYWRIVSRTMAGQTKSGPLWSFVVR